MVDFISNIGNGKLTSGSGAAYVINFFFLAHLSVFFSLNNQAFHFAKNCLPGKLSGHL